MQNFPSPEEALPSCVPPAHHIGCLTGSEQMRSHARPAHRGFPPFAVPSGSDNSPYFPAAETARTGSQPFLLHEQAPKGPGSFHFEQRSPHRKLPSPDTHVPGLENHNSFSDRFDAVKGCFETLPGTDLNDKSVLLIDDILTSGATASECASVLKDSGAKHVYVLTFAR